MIDACAVSYLDQEGYEFAGGCRTVSRGTSSGLVSGTWWVLDLGEVKAVGGVMTQVDASTATTSNVINFDVYVSSDGQVTWARVNKSYDTNGFSHSVGITATAVTSAVRMRQGVSVSLSNGENYHMFASIVGAQHMQIRVVWGWCMKNKNRRYAKQGIGCLSSILISTELEKP